ncbi:MAG: hypothetical protein AB1458_06775 [Bacteroidota bacterium]
MKREEKFFYILLGLITLGIAYIILAAEATFDKGDGIQHYLISRYSWKYPELLLHHWGKPVFTLISSPFAQFGLKGIALFNLLCATLSAWCAYRLAKRLGIANAWAVPFFLFFAVIYFPLINSGLTEPFFGLMLIASVMLFTEQRYTAATLLASFMPLARTEGVLFLPLFFILLLYRKRYIPVLLLGTGLLLYSVIGYFVFKDIFWLITQNPYSGNPGSIYGYGEVLHFVKQYNNIWGLLLTLLLVTGMGVFTAELIKRRAEIRPAALFGRTAPPTYLAEELVLIYGAFVIYFIAHTIFCIMGSLGLVRMMGAIIPVTALICLRGFIWVKAQFAWSPLLKYAVSLLILVLVIRTPFKQYYYPYHLEGEEPVALNTGDWLKKSEYKDRHLYYLHPYLTLAMDIDPFDTVKSTALWGLNREHPENGLKEGSLVIWDAHYGPNEAQIKLEKLIDNPNFRLLKTFEPVVPFTVLGGYDFKIHVFECVAK